MLQLELPYPPTVNTYWRRVGAKTLISKKGRQFRSAVEAIIFPMRLKKLSGELVVEVDVFPPDKRRRDIDNISKALLDSLEHAGVYDDDSQIRRLTIERQMNVAGGRSVVRIWECEQCGARL